jgi:cytosine/adenosine deaminase-related metal-dependent hydrolase
LSTRQSNQNKFRSHATYGAAKVSNKLNDYGSIEAGKIANLIIVNGDPLTDMKDIRKISVVIKQGKRHIPADILDYFGYNYEPKN